MKRKLESIVILLLLIGSVLSFFVLVKRCGDNLDASLKRHNLIFNTKKKNCEEKGKCVPPMTPMYVPGQHSYYCACVAGQ